MKKNKWTDYIKKRTQPHCCALFSFKFGSCCCKWLGDESLFPAKQAKGFKEGIDDVNINI